MCSLSDLTSFSFGDIVSKLKLLFEVVIILFGLMNGGAALGYVLDARLRAHVVGRLKTPEAGFTAVPGDPDCWVWRLQLDELHDDLDAPRGTAVVLSRIMGLPFARLRAALPDEMLTTPLAVALGRRQAFSLSGMLAVHMRQKSKHADAEAGAVAAVAEAASAVASAAAVRLEQMVGTALVLGFLQANCLMHVVELAQHCSAAKRHFHGVTTPNGRDFTLLRTDFITMMQPGCIDLRRKWLPRVRMWKLILSQDADGSWPASSSTAFSLEARATTETANLKQTLLQRIKETFSSAAEEMDADHGGVAEAVLQGLRGETVDEKGTPRMSVVGPAGLDVNPGDDPLTCSADAILAAMPKRLAAVKAADPTVDVVRVWTTLCCVSSLQRLNVSWIWGDGDTYADPEKTIVDAGRLYVERLAAEKPALAKVLASGAVRQAAKRTTAAWKRANEMRVAELRRGEPMTSQMAMSHVHRAGTEMTRALVVGVRLPAVICLPVWLPALTCALPCCSIRHFPCSSPSRWAACSAGRVRHASTGMHGVRRTDRLSTLAVWVILVTLLIEQVRADVDLHTAVLHRADPLSDALHPAQLLVNIWMCVAAYTALVARCQLRTGTLMRTPPAAQVLRQGGQLLRRRADAAGQRAGRRQLPARGRLPRLQWHMRRAAKPVRHRPRAAGLPQRAARLHLHRLPQRRQLRRLLHRGLDLCRHRCVCCMPRAILRCSRGTPGAQPSP